MKKLIICSLAVMLILPGTLVRAAKDDAKGTRKQAYEHASDNAIFNRISDWFATVGKSKEEKEKIIAERKAARQAKSAQKEAEKKAKETKKKMENVKKDLDMKMKKGAK